MARRRSAISRRMPSGPAVTVASSGAAGSASLVVGHVAVNGSDPDRPTFLEAVGLSGAQPAGDACLGRRSRRRRRGESSSARLRRLRPQSRRNVAPSHVRDCTAASTRPESSRCPSRCSPDSPCSTQPPVRVDSVDDRVDDEELRFRPFRRRRGLSRRRPHRVPFQRIVVAAQASPSWVIRTTAVPERSAEAAVRVAACQTAAAALRRMDLPPETRADRNSVAAAAASDGTPPAAEVCTEPRRRDAGCADSPSTVRSG